MNWSIMVRDYTRDAKAGGPEAPIKVNVFVATSPQTPRMLTGTIYLRKEEWNSLQKILKAGIEALQEEDKRTKLEIDEKEM